MMDVTNAHVGMMLASETERVRVWHTHLPPGEALPAHCHVLDYFFTALTAGRSATIHPDGSETISDIAAGMTVHVAIGAGERLVHGYRNVGDTVLSFVIVEFKDGANQALPL